LLPGEGGKALVVSEFSHPGNHVKPGKTLFATGTLKLLKAR